MSLAQRFHQLYCRIQEHDEKNINIICVNKDCKLQRIGCDLCGELHKSHRDSLLSIAEVQRSLEKLKLNEQDPLYQRLSKIIDEFIELSQKKLQLLAQQLKQILLSDIMEIRILKENITTYEELKLAVQQLVEVTYLKDGDIQFKILKPSEIYPKIHNVLDQYLNEINNYWKNNTGYFNEIYERQNPQIQQQVIVQQIQVPQYDQQQFYHFQFSKNFCSQKLKCISPRKIKKTDDSNRDDIACLDKPLSLEEKQSFVFKIITLKGFIGIGISIFQQVQFNNFLLEASECLGHGVFMVLNNSMVYNSSSSEHNYKYGSLKMEQGLRYKLSFDPFNIDGQFSIQALDQNNEIYSMPMQIDEALTYHVFTYIGQKDGEVELMDVS